VESFNIKDCALVVMTDVIKPAMNLRELYDRLGACSEDSIYHHFCETKLRSTYDDPDFPNDFAVWSRRDLNDKILAEKLGIIDPYEFGSIEKLRIHMLEVIDERLGELQHVPWAAPGREFYFLQALKVVFDTGQVIGHPRDFANSLTHMTNSSIYHHFIDTRKKSWSYNNDFTDWLEGYGGLTAEFVNSLRQVDFYFMNLKELKRELITVAAKYAIIQTESVT